MKLKANEKSAYRAKLLEEQDGKCALCEREIPSGQDTLDHDHVTGHCRMVLCRACNGAEGRVLSWIKRSGAKNVKAWVNNLVWYWDRDWSMNPCYPTHRTELEKEIAKLRKAKKKVKRPKTKARYQAKIDRLLKQLRKETK